jgi:ssDNA-binding Zn-finger/Zn-ribbon topoisomerase 1
LVRGKGRGRHGECVCPKCKFTVPKQAGLSCRSRMCPKCGTTMLSKRS